MAIHWLKRLLPAPVRQYREQGPVALPAWAQIWSACWWSAGSIWNAPAAALWRTLRAYVCPRGVITYWSQLPPYDSVEFKLNAALGYRQLCGHDGGDGRMALLHVARSHDTVRRLELPEGAPWMLNLGCDDVGKHRVASVFADVFGYDLGVNPLVYSGWMVCKSNLNARHDGRVIHGPIEASQVDNQCAYQKLIDNQYKEGFVTDLRVPVHGGNVPLVYRKYRPLDSRFSNRNAWAEIAMVNEELTADEVKALLCFAERLGMDYGELDVLRNRTDGRIYVVDANPTPYGPPNGLVARDRRRALRILRESYMDMMARASASSRV